MIDIDELERLASDWTNNPNPSQETRLFIVSGSANAILALIDRLRQSEQERDKFRKRDDFSEKYRAQFQEWLAMSPGRYVHWGDILVVASARLRRAEARAEELVDLLYQAQFWVKSEGLWNEIRDAIAPTPPTAGEGEEVK